MTSGDRGNGCFALIPDRIDFRQRENAATAAAALSLAKQKMSRSVDRQPLKSEICQSFDPELSPRGVGMID
jgi:hypothetical protein